ncbi:MAG: hypothetical protein M3457_21460 [Chloroflexota bacterium]|nr:hypothetical protein [Chloroflexota bacterium]
MAFVSKKAAKPGDPLNPHRSNAPLAPGANRSPQVPGQVPDRSSVPSHGELPVDLPTGEVRRPIAEYGSAQRIMGVYEASDGNENDPARFEQTTVSYEELRKADPSLRTPVRPTLGYALAEGTRIANPGLAALNAEADSDFIEG